MNTPRDSRGNASYRRHRNALRDRKLPCWLCGQPIDYGAPPHHPDSFEADHAYPVSTHPHLAGDPGNLRASHMACNRSRGNNDAYAGRWVRSNDL
ncbi:HNH endonuclease [Tomitella fengzijianii]|uniref:HNH endonuclease n=1 Tax=Tomitella fengzijianii TaxID=2597660 RepID=A0A516X4G1_9ACTN|nr:HNH endonuclease [Tomitella fengzijianii]